MNALYRAGAAILSRLFRVLYRYRIIRRTNIPAGGAICCANHTSWIDPIFLALTQNRQIFFMAKAELFRCKPLAALIRKLGAFPVLRGSGGAEAMHYAGELLDRGELLGIFPEGTRSKTGELQHGKTGIVRLAHERQVPILPAAIVSDGPRVQLFRQTRIVVGAPIMPEELHIQTGTGLEYRNATRLVMSRIAALQQEGRAMLANDKKKNREQKTIV